MDNLEEATEKHNVFSKIYENIRSEINTRSRSRFIGSYVITWIVINWKAPVYFLFAEDSIKEKLVSVFCRPTIGSWLLPLIGVAIYIVIIPLLEELLVYINNLFLHPLKITKLHLEHKSLMAQLKKNIALEQERNRLISEMSNESETKKLIDNNKFLSEQLEELKSMIELKEATIQNLEKDIQNIKRTSRVKSVYEIEPFRTILVSLYNSKDKSISLDLLDEDIIKVLLDNRFIRKDDDRYVLTMKGFDIVRDNLLE